MECVCVSGTDRETDVLLSVSSLSFCHEEVGEQNSFKMHLANTNKCT